MTLGVLHKIVAVIFLLCVSNLAVAEQANVHPICIEGQTLLQCITHSELDNDHGFAAVALCSFRPGKLRLRLFALGESPQLLTVKETANNTEALFAGKINSGGQRGSMTVLPELDPINNEESRLTLRTREGSGPLLTTEFLCYTKIMD